MRHCKVCNRDRERHCFRERRGSNGVPYFGKMCIDCENEKCAEGQRLSRYGMDGLRFRLMVEHQKGVCAICKKPPTSTTVNPEGWCVDHCYKTHRVRGLLCSPCNLGLGAFRDDPEILEAAIQYLKGAT